MNWFLFIIFNIFAFGFLIIGYSFRKRFHVVLGSIFLIILGLLILNFGISLPNGYEVLISNTSIVNQDDNTQVIEFTRPIILTPSYTEIPKEHIFSKWLFGILFILIGTFIGFDAFFNKYYRQFL